MRVVIVGAPGAGKEELVTEILGIDLSLTPIIEHELTNRSADAPALGFLADYRQEMFIAIKRAFAHLYVDGSVMTHSLIDSLSYAGLKLVNASETLGLDDQERAAAAYVITQYLMQDSFKADVVVFLPGNNGESFNVDLEEALEASLIHYDVDYLRLTGDLEQDRDLCVTLIREKYDDTDTRGDTEERQSK